MEWDTSLQVKSKYVRKDDEEERLHKHSQETKE
jgi:hypothetical protein